MFMKICAGCSVLSACHEKARELPCYINAYCNMCGNNTKQCMFESYKGVTFSCRNGFHDHKTGIEQCDCPCHERKSNVDIEKLKLRIWNKVGQVWHDK